MKFAIATVEFWESVGFNVAEWRKNKDGTLAMVHIEFARVLVPDIEDNQYVTVYYAPSAELDILLESEDWK